MKQPSLLITCLAVLFVASSFLLTDHKRSLVEAEHVDIHQAVKEGMVSLTPVSTGEHSGESVKLVVQNLTNRNLELTLPAGTYFEPEDPGDQNIFMPQEASLAVAPSASQVKLVNGYCIDASDASPDLGSEFKMRKSEDKNLLSLCQFMKDKEVDDHNMQAALWSISDGHSVSNIDPGTPDTKSLRQEVARISGQENPWFTSANQVTLDEERHIVRETVRVHGELGFKVEKAGKVTKTIYTADGEERMSRTGDYTLQPRYYEFEFNLRVNGWEQGDYYVVIKVGEQEVHRQDFSI